MARGAMMGAGIASAVASANKNNSNKGSSSSGSSSGSSSSSKPSGSGGSSGSSGSSGGGYQSLGTWHDQGLKENNPIAYNQIQNLQNLYDDAIARGDMAAANLAHQDAEAIRKQYGYSGGPDGSQYISTGGGGMFGASLGGGTFGASLGSQMAGQLQSGYDKYRDYMEWAAAQQQAALKAKVDAAVASLNGQRGEIGKITAQNNAAAERAYMHTIKPNGSLAESLAANGLLTSGATESSQIAAGNSYQNALNANATAQTDAIAELERAITQAQLNGDIEAANAYSQVLQQMAQMGYQNAQDIVAANQWGQNFGLQQAGVTGVYNGAPTLEAQRLQMELRQYEDQKLQIRQQLELGKIDIQTANKQLAMMDKQIAMLNEQIKGEQLNNKYMASQM